MQGLQLVSNLRYVLKQLQKLLHVHLQDFRDRTILEFDLQGFSIVAMAFADRTGHPDIGQKVHFQFVRAISFARFAASARHIKAESPSAESAPLRVR